MRNRLLVLSLLILSILLFVTGCGDGNSNLSDTTIIVEKKGKVTEAIIERFDKSYYNANELELMIKNEIQEYGRLSGDKDNAKLSDYEAGDGVVKAYIEFATPQDYSRFNDTKLFFGTIGEAVEAGYTIDVNLRNIKEGGTIGRMDLMGMNKKHIIISNEAVQIKTYGDILYSTANVEILDDRLARVASDSSGLAYIVLK